MMKAIGNVQPPHSGLNPFNLFMFVVLWHFFLSSSNVLRLNANLFWPAVLIAGILLFWNQIKEIVLTKYELFLAIMIAMLAVSCLFSINISNSLKYTISVVLYSAISFIIAPSIVHKKNFFWMIYGFLALLLAATYIQIIAPDIYIKFLLDLLPGKFHVDILAFMERGNYPGLNNQTSTNAFFMGFGVMVSLYHFRKRTAKKWLHMAMLFSFIVAVFYTGRRGTIVAIMIVFLFKLFRQKKNRLKYVMVVLTSVLVVMGIGVEHIPGLGVIVDKFAFYSDEGDISNGRLRNWERTLDAFALKPIFGYGIDTYSSKFALSSAHNSLVQSLFELGVVGTALLYLPLLYGLASTLRKSFLFSCVDVQSRNKAMMNKLELSLDFQIFVFCTSMVEAYFSNELSLLMLMIFQMMAVRIDMFYRSDERLVRNPCQEPRSL